MSVEESPDKVTAWCGWSGRRYDAAVYRKGSTPPVGAPGSVALAVQRDGNGIAKLLMIDAFGVGMATLGPRDWLKEAKRQGAVEVHVLTPDHDASAVVRDLRSGT